MNYLTNFRNYLWILVACLICCTACAKTSPSSKAGCEQFDELIKMAHSEDMLDLTPDEFIVKYKHLFSVTSDKNSDALTPIVSRTLTFKSAQGDWLVKAEARYVNSHPTNAEKMQIEKGLFSITPSCAPGRRELDARLSQLNPTAKHFLEDPKEESFWQWSHVTPKDQNTRRETTFRTLETTTTLMIERTPNEEDDDSSENGEGEG